MPDTITLTPTPAHRHSAYTAAAGTYTGHSGGWYLRQTGIPAPYMGEHRMRDEAGRSWSRFVSAAVVDDFGDLVEVAS